MIVTVTWVFLLMLVIGVPIAFSMGSAALLGIFTYSDVSLSLVVQRMFTGVNSFTLLAIPLFMLAGQLMETGGISRRLVNLAYSIVGYIRGGLGMSGVGASVIIAGISGSAAADTAAVGSIMIPAMKTKRYPAGLAATLQACAGSLGTIIPPSLTMILYAVITEVSISRLFLAGIIPGLLMGLGLMTVTYLYGKKYNLKEEGRPRFNVVIKSLKEAFWALMMPLLILGGIVTGIFTATEAGVIAVVYALVVGLLIYKEFTLRDIPKIFADAAANTSMVLLIVAGASILGWVIAYTQIPLLVVNTLASLTESPYLILLLLIAFILFIGMFIETLAATIIIAPLLGPIVSQFGFDPIHFGFVIVATLIFAGVTPPVGPILNITMGIGRAKMKELLPFLPPYIGCVISVLILVVFIPEIVTFLPNLFLE
ncbi:TRAP transporter large permease [Tuberibacillus sp. Marseille-P3662]|uniref:TRAP transporter large permease n=1 Tax=Tuberibacillus sp. Marseille-P3662 TaxID=1965358 RepID=UPI000A1C7FBA|nr:TRAP transporter large permease [Tuberibacillus sp. Marseille-P3662]